MLYVTNETSKTPIFQINDHIGDDKDILDENGGIIQKGDGQGIDGRIFANEVLSYNDNDFVQELIFYVNSQGGDVQKSLDMFNAISMSKKKTHSIITGFAFSCAGWIPLAADKVEMVEETGRWMCHMPYDPNDPEQKSVFMDEVIDIISNTIASKSGRNNKPKKTQEEIKKLMQETTYWNAQSMLDAGLIDNKVNAKGKVIRFEKDPITLNREEINFFYKENQVFQNKLIITETQKTNKIMFPKLVNRLNKVDEKALGFKINLAEDSTEDVLLDTIVRIENRIRVMNDESMEIDNKSKLKDAENKIALDAAKKLADDKAKEASDSMTQYNAMKESFDKMELENKAMKTEKEEAANNAKVADLKFRTERAVNFVDKLIEQKKVVATDDMTIDKIKEYLVNKATTNYEDIATQYSLIPIRAVGPKMKTSGRLENGTVIDVNLITKMVADNSLRVAKKQYTVENGVKISRYDGKIITE